MDFNLCVFFFFWIISQFHSLQRQFSTINQGKPASPNILRIQGYFPETLMPISCQYMFAKPTKIDCAKERTLVWKDSYLERRKFRQACEVQYSEVDGHKEMAVEECFSPLVPADHVGH